MRRLAAAAAAALLLAACGRNPQELPVGVAGCRAVPGGNGFGVVATIENKAGKPLSHLSMAMSFYSDFRYRKFAGRANLSTELDPGQKREVAFVVPGSEGTRMNGPAMGCFVTRLEYLDGTSQDAPRPQ